MTSQKSVPGAEKRAARTTLSLEQLIDAHRPLLALGMTRMLRGDGTVSSSLQHDFRFFQALHRDPVRMSARRWKAALLRSRILRGHRIRVNRAQ
ncbi:MAG TPA: hypothetical protein VF850_02995 [Gemmatimonadaceae bacterium]